MRALAGLGLGALVGPAALVRAALGSEPEADAADEPPAWATFSDALLSTDLDGDGVDEVVELRDRRLVVRCGTGVADSDDGAGDKGILLETPKDWQVSDVFAADFDGDGALEVVFLLWRHGNFGSSRPFWLSDAGDGGGAGEPLTQHLFMYRWRSDGGPGGRLHPVWMSSRLGVEAAHIKLVPAADGAEGPGGSALADGSSTTGDISGSCVPAIGSSAMGGRPQLCITSADGDVTLWEWLSWGFALIEGGDGDAGASTVAALGSAEADGAGPSALSLLVVGDMIAHPNVYEGAYDAATRDFDFSPIFDHVRGRIAAFDLAAVCQETVLVENPARRSGYPLFATPQSLGNALAGAGFDIVLGATNHANDQGPEGIDETTAFWAREHPGVTLLGLHAEPEAAGGPAYLERNGIRLALFDYTDGLNGRNLSAADAYRVDTLAGAPQGSAGPAAPDGSRGDVGASARPAEGRLLADVASACDQADLVICFLHIGDEYDSEPTGEQRGLVERLIDAGAGAIICSHTHVLGPYGRVRTAAGNEGVVFYGLGNFVSGQCDDIRTILGGAAVLRVEKASPKSADTAGQSRPTARVASLELEPLVCHTDAADGSVAVYFLDDYSDELASSHVLGSLTGAPLTVADLRACVPEELR